MSAGEWTAFGHREECLICRRTGGWCTVSPNGDAVQCARVESAHPVKQKDGTVKWLHPIPDELRPRARSLPARRPAEKRQRLTTPEWVNLWKQHRSSVNPQKLRRFSERLGVSVESLEAYGIGFDRETGCWSWPMYDGRQKIVGIRIRSEDGRVKACVKGRANQNGLFIPEGFSLNPLSPDLRTSNNYPLFLATPEGPTDGAAAWDLGITAVGRPNSSSGNLFLRQLLGGTPHRQEVVVVGENDGPVWPQVPGAVPLFPGIAGALSCCRELLDAAGILRLVMPPRPVKDFRDWKLAGATAADVAIAVGKAAKIDADWLRRAEAAMERRKAGAVALFGRMCGRVAQYAEQDRAVRAERMRSWMRRRGYPVDVQRRAAA
jgi:hypothetical protein